MEDVIELLEENANSFYKVGKQLFNEGSVKSAECYFNLMEQCNEAISILEKAENKK